MGYLSTCYGRILDELCGAGVPGAREPSPNPAARLKSKIHQNAIRITSHEPHTRMICTTTLNTSTMGYLSTRSGRIVPEIGGAGVPGAREPSPNPAARLKSKNS